MNAEHVTETYGTPAYVYDRRALAPAHADLRRALPEPSALYYSLKANPHPDLAAHLATLGCRAEVSSVGELDTALEAGFAPPDILVTGPGKTTELLATALRRDVRRFSVDSPGDIDRLDVAARRGGTTAEFLLRVNAETPVVGMGMTMTGTASQFGADASWLLAEPERFRSRGSARLIGLHLYMGTNVEDPAALALELETSIKLAGHLSGALSAPLQEVNLGGGFGHPYARSGGRPRYPQLRKQLELLLDEHLAGWRERAPLASFESGRYLVAGCGQLVCSVVDVKVSKGRTFVILDSGIHHLGGMSGLRRLPRVVPELLVPGTDQDIVEGTVAGPLCTPLDTWSVGARLPKLAAGDLVTVPNVGAYGLTASLLAFLGHPPACEIVVDGTEVVSATRLTLTRVPIAERAPRDRGGEPASDEVATAGEDGRRTRFGAILRDHLPLLPPDAPLRWDALLRRHGLDSLQTVTLILELEDAFGVMLPDSSLEAATFATASSLWTVVRDACGGAFNAEGPPADRSELVLTDEPLDNSADVVGPLEERVMGGAGDLGVAGGGQAGRRTPHALGRDDDVQLATDEQHRHRQARRGGQRIG